LENGIQSVGESGRILFEARIGEVDIVSDAGNAAIYLKRKTRSDVRIYANAAHSANQKLVGGGRGKVGIGTVSPDERPYVIGLSPTPGGKGVAARPGVLYAAGPNGPKACGIVVASAPTAAAAPVAELSSPPRIAATSPLALFADPPATVDT